MLFSNCHVHSHIPLVEVSSESAELWCYINLSIIIIIIVLVSLARLTSCCEPSNFDETRCVNA